MSADRRYYVASALLFGLILARLAYLAPSTAGIKWDFVNYYNTGCRVWHGEWASLYRSTEPIAGRPPLGDVKEGQLEYAGFPLSALFFGPLGAFEPQRAIVTYKAACGIAFLVAMALLYTHFFGATRAGSRSDGRRTAVASAEGRCHEDTEGVGEFRGRIQKSAPTPPLPYGRGSDTSGSAPAEMHAATPRSLALFLLLALLFEPFWFCFVIGGQSTPMAFLFVVLFLRLYVAGRCAAAAFCFSIAALLKPVLAPAALVLFVAMQWRLLAWTAAIGAVEALLSLAVFGWDAHREWYEVFSRQATRWAVPWWNNASPLAFFANFWLYGPDPQFGLRPKPQSMAMLLKALKLLLVGLFAWRAWTVRASAVNDAEKRRQLVMLGIVFSLCFTQVSWPHYLVFLLIPIVYVATRYAALPLGGRVLAWLIVLSTFRAEHYHLTLPIKELIPFDSPIGAMLLGLYGGGTLILSLFFIAFYRRGPLTAGRSAA